MEIIGRIGEALNTLYPEIEVYVDDIRQGATEPYFVLQFVSKRDMKIAGIKCNKAYTIDITYASKEESDLYKVMDSLEKKLYSLVAYLSYDMEIIEKEGHFVIEVIAENPATKEEYSGDGFYQKLVEKVKELSHKPCYFLTVDLKKVDFEKGFFILKPLSLAASTISLNHRKEYEQEIELVYLENSERHPMKILEEHEQLIQALSDDTVLRKEYINLDYEIEVEDEEEEKEVLDFSHFTTTLTVKRRG
ncbi:hypothetical protein A2U16_03205 [Fusobacterium necrophorum subsp. funduliforme]|uniref:phage tail terminator family protein n=1 Tax=Fusobacterium necrophorum TaxID=859 RepID=UPI000788FC79|nr:hypothetical protein [Fusobacterium necrophorum]KYM65520.1 hypothetical protein A2U16_03205 [Fusobacterium necrophorum subsp. funduliforme]MCI7343396.1 hypothetical protein [Fusobacterium necrophorum]